MKYIYLFKYLVRKVGGVWIFENSIFDELHFFLTFKRKKDTRA